MAWVFKIVQLRIAENLPPISFADVSLGVASFHPSGGCSFQAVGVSAGGRL